MLNSWSVQNKEEEPLNGILFPGFLTSKTVCCLLNILPAPSIWVCGCVPSFFRRVFCPLSHLCRPLYTPLNTLIPHWSIDWEVISSFSSRIPQCFCIILHSAFISSNSYLTHWYLPYAPWLKTKSLIWWVLPLSFVSLFSNEETDLEDSVTVSLSKSLWGNNVFCICAAQCGGPHSQVTTEYIKHGYWEQGTESLILIMPF